MTPFRPALPLLATLAALGLGACGGTEGGIPRSDADTLREELGDVARFVEEERCDEVDGQVRQVRAAVAELPNSVDDELVANLNDGVAVLDSAVASDCQEQRDQQEDDEVQQEEVPTLEEIEPPEEQEEEEPPDDGTTTPPDDGTTTPPDDGTTTPPDDGGGGGNGGGGNSGGGNGGGSGPGAVVVPQGPTREEGDG